MHLKILSKNPDKMESEFDKIIDYIKKIMEHYFKKLILYYINYYCII